MVKGSLNPYVASGEHSKRKPAQNGENDSFCEAIERIDLSGGFSLERPGMPGLRLMGMGKSKLTRFFYSCWAAYRSAPSRSIGWKSKLVRLIFVCWGGIMAGQIVRHDSLPVLTWTVFTFITLLLFIADLLVAAAAKSTRQSAETSSA